MNPLLFGDSATTFIINIMNGLHAFVVHCFGIKCRCKSCTDRSQNGHGRDSAFVDSGILVNGKWRN